MPVLVRNSANGAVWLAAPATARGMPLGPVPEMTAPPAAIVVNAPVLGVVDPMVPGTAQLGVCTGRLVNAEPSRAGKRPKKSN